MLWRRVDAQVAPFDLPVAITRSTGRAELNRGGANLWHVKEMLGHEHLDTLQHYAKLTITDLKKMHANCHPANARVETYLATPMLPPMSMTLDQIIAEARQLPREQAAELFDRLLADTFGAPDAEIEQAWKTETRRRIAEIESGAEPGVPGEEVMAELRRIVGR